MITARPEMASLSDDALIAGFEAGTLPAASFDHVAHVRVAWVYLGRLPPEVALLRICAGIRQLATRVGHPGKYHATITWAYVALVSEHRRDGESFETFRERCPSLFDGNELRRMYPDGALKAARTREAFVFPSRLVTHDI